jgi:hypothetical protein
MFWCQCRCMLALCICGFCVFYFLCVSCIHAKTSTFGPCFDLCLITTHTNITSDPDAYDLFYPPSMRTIILFIGIGTRGNQIQPMSSNSQIVSTLLQWIIPLWLWEQLIVTSSSSTCRALRSLCFRTAYARCSFIQHVVHLFSFFWWWRGSCFYCLWLVLLNWLTYSDLWYVRRSSSVFNHL